MTPLAPTPAAGEVPPLAGPAPSTGPLRVDPAEPLRPPLPRQGFGWLRYLNYVFGVSICYAVDLLWLRMKVFGLENIPKYGPFLLLPNHTTFIDPFVICYPIFRPMRYMATAALLRVPLLGPWVAALGAYPKMKFVKDPASMATTQRLWEQDQLITIFPEGRRTWDGDPTEVSEGIGRLIQRLDARVVFATLENAYLMHPRWARYPRRVPLKLRYHGPFRYPSDWTPEQISADVRARVRAPQAIDPGAKVWTWRMAWGLPSLIWSCLRCHALGGLEVDPQDGDRVVCRSCGAAWRVDVECRLRGEAGAADSTVRDAYRDIRDHFGYPPRVGDPPTDGAEVLRVPAADVRRVEGKRRVPVAAGPMVLRTDRVEVEGPGGAILLLLPLAELRALSIELGDRVQVRHGDVLYDISPVGQSALLWGHFIKGWMHPGERVDAG